MFVFQTASRKNLAHTALFGSLLLLIALVSLTPLPPYDFWWHLKVGQLITEQGIPHTNLFAWTLHADTPYVYGEWLGGWLFYQLYLLGGLAAPAIARNLLGTLLFSGLGVLLFRRSQSWWITSALLLCAGMLTYNNLYARPQIWAWLPFLVFVWVISTLWSPVQTRVWWPSLLRWLLLPVVMIFWVNVHGSFVLGLVLLGLTTLGETITILLRWRHARSWKTIGVLACTTLGCLVATLVNPLGVGIYDYLWSITTSPTIRTIIQEWQPPLWNRFSGVCFYLSVGVVVLVGLLRWRRFTFAEGLIAVAFMWLACTSLRMVFWYAIVLLPMLAHAFARAATDGKQTLNTIKQHPAANARRRHKRQQPSPSPIRDTALAINTSSVLPLRRELLVASALLVGCFCLFQPPARYVLPWHTFLRQNVIDMPGALGTYRNDTPVAATEYLRQHPQPGRIFNDVGAGSYLIWAMGTEQPVFIDPRVELFPLDLWQDYQAIAAGSNYNELLITKYNISRLILNRNDQRRLVQALHDDPRWAREYIDLQVEIYTRVNQ